MKCCTVKLGAEEFNGKEGFRFNIYCCLKIWQNFEMEVCLLRRRGILTCNFC